MNGRIALWSMRLDGVVSFAMERVAGDVEGCHVLVGDDDVLGSGLVEQHLALRETTITGRQVLAHSEGGIGAPIAKRPG